VEKEKKSYWEQLGDLCSPPYERLQGKIEELREISTALEAGGEIDPQRLKKLAGSLDYWADKLEKIPLRLVFRPEIVVGACLEAKAFIEQHEQAKAALKKRH
jgi:hypothetical protein